MELLACVLMPNQPEGHQRLMGILHEPAVYFLFGCKCNQANISRKLSEVVSPLWDCATAKLKETPFSDCSILREAFCLAPLATFRRVSLLRSSDEFRRVLSVWIFSLKVDMQKTQ